jgi:hypothetical protein
VETSRWPQPAWSLLSKSAIVQRMSSHRLLLFMMLCFGLACACVVFDESLLTQDSGPTQDVNGDANDDPDASDDVAADSSQDTLSDTGTDTGGDVAADSSQDTSDVPPPAPVCVSYDHDCNSTPHYYYPGTANQDCTAVCASHGGFVNSTINVIGHSGTTTHCRRVLQTMFNTANTVATGTYATGVGCSRLNGSALRRYTVPNTAEGAEGGDIERACACVTNSSCQIYNGHCP